MYLLRPRREIHDLAHSRKEFFPCRAALHKRVALLHTALHPFGVALCKSGRDRIVERDEVIIERPLGYPRALENVGLGYAVRFGPKDNLELTLEANRGASERMGVDSRAMLILRVAQ